MFYLLPKRIFLVTNRPFIVHIHQFQTEARFTVGVLSSYYISRENSPIPSRAHKPHQVHARLFELCDVFSPRAAPEKRFSVEMEDEI